MPAETVIGAIARDRLSDVLVAVHRARLGPQTRVLDGARGALAAQLRRAGLPPDAAPLGGVPEETMALILISAPGRSVGAADVLRAAGARAVIVPDTSAVPAVPVAATPPTWSAADDGQTVAG